MLSLTESESSSIHSEAAPNFDEPSNPEILSLQIELPFMLLTANFASQSYVNSAA